MRQGALTYSKDAQHMNFLSNGKILDEERQQLIDLRCLKSFSVGTVYVLPCYW